MPIDLPTELSIRDWPLPYESRLHVRPLEAIDLVVIHCTELPDMAMTREFGERIHHAATQTGNSGHYYIDSDGSVSRFVADNRVANIGRYPHWGDSRYQTFSVAYTKQQIDALLLLLRQLRHDLPNLKYIAGHEDLDRRLEPASDDPAIMLPRRQDPGPLFPWTDVVPASGLQRMIPEG
jgi:N-acetylmuramoyl-L-alanine amidase